MRQGKVWSLRPMNLTLRFFLVVGLLVITAYRLPAPVSEIPETPTPAPPTSIPAIPAPAPAEQVTPNPVASLQGAARFAGTWTGTITQPTSTGKVSLLFNATATSVILAGRARPTTVNGNTISWRSGMFNGNAWTLTLNDDEKTAHVTVYSGALGQWSATFHRDKG